MLADAGVTTANNRGVGAATAAYAAALIVFIRTSALPRWYV